MLVTGIPFGTSSPLAEQVRGPGSWGRPALRCDHAAPADVRDYGGVGPTVDHSHDPAMKQPGQLTPHLALRRGSILGRTVLLCAGLAFLAACGEDRTGPETPSYRITDGPACGDVVFAESLGADSAAAFHAMQARKAEQFGEGEITLELHRLEVVDRRGNVPEPRFYAVFVLEAGSGSLMHSVAEVITTEGDLFHLFWCPD